MTPRQIALDGPAAAGKSTVGRRLAEELGSLYFDTGALYRALTVLALERNATVDDESALADIGQGWSVTVRASAEDPGYTVHVGGRDITDDLRRSDVDANVAAVSRHPAVRQALLENQRTIARAQPVVMVGRDIGTVVLPDADLKLFLDASLGERARRRFRERLADGEAVTYAEVLEATRSRDAADSGRSAAPLARAPDAVAVSTDGCDVDGVVEHLVRIAGRWPDRLTTKGGEAPCRDPDS